MFETESGMATGLSTYEPAPRWGHFCARIGEQLYVWGGYIKGKEHSELKSTVHTFDLLLESWDSNKCTGDSPLHAMQKGACTPAGHYLYQYGGHDPSKEYGTFWIPSMHRLDTDSWTWTSLPHSDAAPMGKDGFGMVTHRNKLVSCLVAMVSPLAPLSHAGATFNRDTRYRDASGWTNELHSYDLVKGEKELHGCISFRQNV